MTKFLVEKSVLFCEKKTADADDFLLGRTDSLIDVSRVYISVYFGRFMTVNESIIVLGRPCYSWVPREPSLFVVRFRFK